MDYYQKWVIERVNELYDYSYNINPDQVRQYVTEHGKASLAVLALAVYVIKRERTHKEFRSLRGLACVIDGTTTQNSFQMSLRSTLVCIRQCRPISVAICCALRPT